MFDLIKHLIKNDIAHDFDNGKISVHGDLDLEDMSEVDVLPDNLSVGGSLDLCGTSITTLPDNFKCQSLYLDPQRISNAAYRENCGNSSHTIFAAWTGENFFIAAGCFFGPLDKFEEVVDNRYSGDAAEGYKRAGRECVAELTEKLNPKN